MAHLDKQKSRHYREFSIASNEVPTFVNKFQVTVNESDRHFNISDHPNDLVNIATGKNCSPPTWFVLATATTAILEAERSNVENQPHRNSSKILFFR